MLDFRKCPRLGLIEPRHDFGDRHLGVFAPLGFLGGVPRCFAGAPSTFRLEESGVGFLLATTHNDLTDDLNPNLHVRCLGDGAVECDRRAYVEAMRPPLADALPALAEAARTVGGPQIRNRGTIGGNLGTASPAGDALPPLLVADARIRLVSVRGEREVALQEFLLGPKRNALAGDELIAGVTVEPMQGRETFMKVGPRNAMVIAVVSLALRVDGELRAAYGSAGPVAALVRGGLDEAEELAERVADAASPIDDVRGTAGYRRHALRVLTTRALERCLAAA